MANECVDNGAIQFVATLVYATCAALVSCDSVCHSIAKTNTSYMCEHAENHTCVDTEIHILAAWLSKSLREGSLQRLESVYCHFGSCQPCLNIRIVIFC